MVTEFISKGKTPRGWLSKRDSHTGGRANWSSRTQAYRPPPKKTFVILLLSLTYPLSIIITLLINQYLAITLLISLYKINDTNLSIIMHCTSLYMIEHICITRRVIVSDAIFSLRFIRVLKNMRAPSFRPTCFRTKFFVQSVSSNPIRFG